MKGLATHESDKQDTKDEDVTKHDKSIVLYNCNETGN